MNHVAEAVHHAGAVEVQPRRHLVLKGIEASPLAERLGGLDIGMPADGLEEWMTGRDPFEVVLLSRVAVGGAAWIFCRQGWKLPVRLALMPLKRWWRPGGLEGMGHTLHDLEFERDVFGRLSQEAGDGLGHDATLLGQGPALDQHLQVELLGRQAFKGVLADGPEAPFVHVFE